MRLSVPFAFLFLMASPAFAGPCTDDINRMQAAADERLDTAAAEGPPGTETTAAKLHHQPTANSIAQAETKLGDLPAGVATAFEDAMKRARVADATGDAAGCAAALSDAGALLKP